MNEDKSDTLRDDVSMHPIGAGVGAVGGIAAGAALGAMAGPVGALVGAVVGGTAGGVAGGEVAESAERDGIDENTRTDEDAYWRDNFQTRPYVGNDGLYGDYQPAYYYGVDTFSRYDGNRGWEEAESDLGAGWDTVRGSSRLSWDEAKHATRDAWERLKAKF